MLRTIRRALLALLLMAAVSVPQVAGADDDATDPPIGGLAEYFSDDWPTSARPVGERPEPVDFNYLAAFEGHDPDASAPAPVVTAQVQSAAMTEYNVTTDLDIVNAADGVLSLREAFNEANADGTDSTINLPLGTTFGLSNCGPDPAQEDANVDGDLDHTEANALTIVGSNEPYGLGDIDDIVVIATACTERIIHTTAPGLLTIRGVALFGGTDMGSGGGNIAAAGSVVLERSALGDGSTVGGGGGLFTFGDAELIDSIVVGNEALIGGGVVSLGNLTMRNTAMLANTADGGAAVVAAGNANIEFSSVWFNESTVIGAADVFVGANLVVGKSVLGGSLGPSLACSVGGVSTSGGYNFVTDASCGLGGATDTEALGGDPGFVELLFPAPGGALHNAVPAAACTLGPDVLGTSRPQGAGCEIGAVETVVPSVPALSASTDAATPVVFNNVLAQLVDPFGTADSTSLHIKTSPSNGTAELVGQKLTYTPGTETAGVDTFSLEICDGAGIDCGTIPVKITTSAGKSRWFFTNALQGGNATNEIVFGRGVGDEFWIGDFNGDGIDDLARRAKGTNVFEINYLGGVAANKTFGYGKPGDQAYVGDFDGDGIDTIAVRRGNQFFVKNSVNPGPADVVIGYGIPTDEVFLADLNGDGRDTFVVRRGNVFFGRNTITTGVADLVWGYGKGSDEVHEGDYDGDGVTTFAVRRGKTIFVRNDFATAPAEFSFGFGLITDELHAGDWTGNGSDTFVVRRIVG